MRYLKMAAILVTVGAALAGASTRSLAQSRPSSEPEVIPKDATALQGVPTVRVETTTEGTTRRELTAAEANQQQLSIQLVNGRFYWTSRQNQPLNLHTAGEFTYLSTADPGQYVRFRRVNDRITYVEHVDVGFGSVTYWGELRIALGK